MQVEAERVDIATSDMAVDVHLQVLADYYTHLLAGVQEGAEQMGYCFVEMESPESESLPPALQRALAVAFAEARLRHLYGEATSKDVWADIKSGYVPRFLEGILQALAVKGLGLRAGAESLRLLAEWELAHPPLLEEEMNAVVDAFFAEVPQE